MNRIQPSLFIAVFLIVVRVATAQTANPPSAAMTASQAVPVEIRFNGPAAGGILYLIEAPVFGETPSLYIQTEPGETPDQVAAKFMLARSERWLTPEIAQIRPSGAGGLLSYQFFFLSGTEKGLGIPPPPTSLTYCYRQGDSQVELHWENPPEAYDKIEVQMHGLSFDLGPDANSITLPSTHFSTDPLHDGYGVIGYKNGTPSSAASVQSDDCAFDESISFAFYDNVMPNWRRWSGSAVAPILSEARREALGDPYSESNPDKKTRYQKIAGASAPFMGGVLRRFVGLTSGTSYKFCIRVNTLESPAPGDWTASIHVAAHAKGTVLTPEQLAGTAALPNGQSGPSAGQMALYYSRDHGGASEPSAKTTNGLWARRETGEIAPDNLAGALMLQDGHDAITVWCRLQGQAEAAQLGIDWIKLERLDCAP